MLAAIRQRLAQYLAKPELGTALTPMQEWSFVTGGELSENEVLQAYAIGSGLPVLEEEESEHLERFPDLESDYLTQWLCLPIYWDAESVLLAVATPYYLAELSMQWHHLLGRRPRFALVRRSLLERHINALYEKREDEGAAALAAGANASEQALLSLASEAPVVRLVNDMFARALENGASDIHVEPAEQELAIRFRVDGVLQTVLQPPLAMYPAIASRLKLIGNLNIAEHRLPQDGRTELRLGRAQVDVRISTIPTMHGESIVLRILRKDTVNYSLDNIGMDGELRARFTELIGLPHGMLLVVGPTGSGKTTTLYCAMGLLNAAENKIITIEDPVEYQIRGVTQMQVKPAIGLTFADGLRHIVRQDPDIIFVGEIRDRETADIAVHAALTGHLVLSTLHTNDAVGAVNRLLDMGVEDFLLSSALVGVLSQRLVRRICPDCRGTGQGGEGRPCRPCTGNGYRGRVGIFELLTVNEDLRRAIRENADSAALNAIARRHGMRPLREDGAAKVAAGVTTAEEVARVCQLDLE